MSVSSVNNKRIAKNTLFLYFRQILVMAVSLYTVRVVLEVLGEEDYGIYNVVGGFVALFNILSGALSAVSLPTRWGSRMPLPCGCGAFSHPPC